MYRVRIPALAVFALAAFAGAARAQMVHPAGMSHEQVIAAASRGGPEFISRNAAIAWIDSSGTLHPIREGSNGFTCVIVRPDPFAGAICGDQNAAAWLLAMLHGAAAPPAMSAPGIAYMAEGGTHFEDAQGNVLMEHELSPHAAGSHRVREQAHWMLIWPFEAATSGLPTKENATGTYIMFAGTPWAHLMVYQDPGKMMAPMSH
jgi:hypothetical protein